MSALDNVLDVRTDIVHRSVFVVRSSIYEAESTCCDFILNANTWLPTDKDITCILCIDCDDDHLPRVDSAADATYIVRCLNRKQLRDV